MATKKPAKKTTLRRKVAIKKPLSVKKTPNKSVTKKRSVTKPLNAKKLATKSKSYKKTPVKRVSARKNVKVSKPFGIFVIASGILALLLLFVYALPIFTDLGKGGKPVLGATANGAPVSPAFTDPNFYACVIDNLNWEKIDAKSDRTYAYNASEDELAKLQTLYCSGHNKADNLQITDTIGIEKMTALKTLRLMGIPKLVSVTDLSQLRALETLDLSRTSVSSVDISKNTALRMLYVEYSQFTSIDVTKNTALIYINASGNKLATIDVTKNTTLEYLDLYGNQLTAIDVTKNTALTSLSLMYNNLSSIDILNNKALNYFYCSGGNKNLVTIKAFTAPSYDIAKDYSYIVSAETDISTFLNEIQTSSPNAQKFIDRNGVRLNTGKLAVGDRLAVKIGTVNDVNIYNFYYKITVPTVLSYGNLTSSIDTKKGIIYRRPLSFAKSVDVNQIKVSQGNVTIKAAYMAYKDGSKISQYGFLINGNKLVIKLSDGSFKEFTVKTAWSWSV